MTPEEYVAEFDRLFQEEKRRIIVETEQMLPGQPRPNPFSDAYGITSAALNRELREQCKEPQDPLSDTGEAAVERMRLRWAYAYWWNRTHLLEEMARSILGGSKTKKNLERGGKTLKELISGDVSPDQLHPDFKRLVDTLNSMKATEAGFVRKSGDLFRGETAMGD